MDGGIISGQLGLTQDHFGNNLGGLSGHVPFPEFPKSLKCGVLFVSFSFLFVAEMSVVDP